MIEQSQPIRLGELGAETLLSKEHLILRWLGLLSCIEYEPFQSWSREGLVISTAVIEYGRAAFSCRACSCLSCRKVQEGVTLLQERDHRGVNKDQ